MGSPAIFSGKRTKLLSTKGILNSDTSINDNDGILNYIKNGHAEVNALGWATYADAAGVLPVDGTGGTPTHITFTQTSTAPLGGLGSFLVNNSGSTSAQGEGASYNFTIDAKDQAKVLQINFDYLVNSGTFVAGSSGVDSDLEVYIYDVTNALIIQPSSYKLLSNSTTIADKFAGTFQTASNSTSYRLILHCPTTATAAWSIKLDNVTVSPSQYVYGSPVTDWVAYTPTFTNINGGTTATSKSQWRRVGDSMEITGILVASGTGIAISGAVVVSIPSGFIIDSTKITISPNTSIGNGRLAYPNTNNWPMVACVTSTTAFFFIVSNTATGNGDAVSSSVPIASTTYWVAGSSISWNIKVPILGWSSSVQMSDSAALNVVDFVGYVTANTALTAGVTQIPLTSIKDSNGAWTTNQYVIPVAGDYQFFANAQFTTAITTLLQVYVDGAVTTSIAACTSSTIMSGGGMVPNLKAGQVVSFRTNNPLTIAGNNTLYFSINRLSGPSAIAATEEISLSYNNVSAPSIANGGTGSAITGWNKIYDSHSAFNATTSVFTAPAAGRYAVSGGIGFTSASNALTTEFAILCTQAGSMATFVRLGSIYVQATHTSAISVPGREMIFNCIAGDTISFYAYQTTGSARTLINDVSYNTVSIKRVK